MIFKKIILASLGLLLLSCHDELSKAQIDAIISKYDREDFSALKGSYVGYRGKDETANVMLMVAQFDLTCPAYIATVEPKTKELIKTDDHLIKESDHKCSPYFNNSQVQDYTKAFLKYDFKVVGVDAGGNVYINPTEQDVPNILRKSSGTDAKDLKDFKHYKGNWYIRKAD